MSEVILNVQVFPNLPVEGQEFTVTRVVASADCGEVGYSSERLLHDDAVHALVAYTSSQVIDAAKRDALQELTVTLVANGVL